MSTKTRTTTIHTIERIKAYMHLCLDLGEHQAANEANCTTLAEDAADEFRGYNLPEDYLFELAFEVSQEWEQGES